MASFELVPGRWIGRNHKVFVVAEVGQNHQGCPETARRLVRAAKEAGADCVKFQKSRLDRRFNAEALARPYHSVHSWGPTYGAHRRHLELSEPTFRSLQNLASDLGLAFSSSAMDDASLEFLKEDLDLPFFKLGSGDADNLTLLRQAAALGRPLLVSTGMQDIASVERIYSTVLPLNSRLSLLHCTSAYPTRDGDVNLRILTTYQERFPEAVIGYSGHEASWEVTLAAVALGAKVVERHLTLDNTWKGSDHACSLEPDEFARMVRGIRRVEAALGSPNKRRLPCEDACYRKLGKTVVSERPLAKGTRLAEGDVVLKVAEPRGLPGHKLDILTSGSAILTRDIGHDESITEDDVDFDYVITS